MVSKKSTELSEGRGIRGRLGFFNRDDSSPNKASRFLEHQTHTIPTTTPPQIVMRHTRGIICPFF